MIYYLPNQSERLNAAVEQFMKEGHKDPKAGIVPVWVAKTSKVPAILLMLIFYADATPFPESLKPFTDIPSFKSSLKVATLNAIISEHTSPGGDGFRHVDASSLTLCSSASAVEHSFRAA